MFIRRLYFNPETGEVLHSYMMQGSIKPISVHQEAINLSFENWSVMEWTTPDPEIEQNFVDSYGRVSIDVTGEEPTLIFDFSPLPDPEPTEYELYYDAISAELEE